MLGWRLGWNVHDMNRADGLEIYISQGAKPGLGGQLMAKKVTPELARIRGIPHGIDLRSPSRHPTSSAATISSSTLDLLVHPLGRIGRGDLRPVLFGNRLMGKDVVLGRVHQRREPGEAP